MDVTLLYFDGCPNWTLARDRLQDVMRGAGLDERALTYRKVETLEDADAVGFRGSPTILIDGRDPFGRVGTRRRCLSLVPDPGGARRLPVDRPTARRPGAVRDSSEGRVIAIGALGLAVCCALPVLVGSGVVASLAGLWSGRGPLVVAGLILTGLVGVRRWRRWSCAMPTGSDQASPSGSVDGEERRRAQPH